MDGPADTKKDNGSSDWCSGSDVIDLASPGGRAEVTRLIGQLLHEVDKHSTTRRVLYAFNRRSMTSHYWEVVAIGVDARSVTLLVRSL